jgi:hypothetical protein
MENVEDEGLAGIPEVAILVPKSAFFVAVL